MLCCLATVGLCFFLCHVVLTDLVGVPGTKHISTVRPSVNCIFQCDGCDGNAPSRSQPREDRGGHTAGQAWRRGTRRLVSKQGGTQAPRRRTGSTRAGLCTVGALPALGWAAPAAAALRGGLSGCAERALGCMGCTGCALGVVGCGWRLLHLCRMLRCQLLHKPHLLQVQDCMWWRGQGGRPRGMGEGGTGEEGGNARHAGPQAQQHMLGCPREGRIKPVETQVQEAEGAGGSSGRRRPTAAAAAGTARPQGSRRSRRQPAHWLPT